MQPARSKTLYGVVAAGVILLMSGCINTIHQISVDSITDHAAPTAFSFRLAPKRPALAREARLYAFATATIEAALAARGLFPAPAGARPPDIIIEIDYGVGNTIPAPNSAPIQEKFLTLSARAYSANAARTPELWNVRTVLHEAGADVEHSLPLLAYIAIDFAGRDTEVEQVVPLSEKDPAVREIRVAAEAATAR